MSYGSSLGQKDSDRRSKLSHVRGFGSSKKGSSNWLLTRVLLVFSIPLSIYLLIALLDGCANSYKSFVGWLSMPFNATVLILYFITFTWYVVLEVIEAIEDYIHKEGVNFMYKLLLKGIMGFLTIFAVISILLLHLKAD